MPSASHSSCSSFSKHETSTNAGPLLGRRRRQRANIRPTLGGCVVFLGVCFRMDYVGPCSNTQFISRTTAQWWVNICDVAPSLSRCSVDYVSGALLMSGEDNVSGPRWQQAQDLHPVVHPWSICMIPVILYTHDTDTDSVGNRWAA